MIPKEDKFRHTKDGLLYVYLEQDFPCAIFDDEVSHKLIIRKGSLLGIRFQRIQEFTVLKYIQKLKNKNLFVETGTQHGQMIELVKDFFKEVVSIEIDKDFYEKAKEKFKDSNVKLIHGDSGVLIPTKADFYWLDAHTPECPLMNELKRIERFEYILIDDSINMTGTGGFPTLSEIANFVKDKWNAVCLGENGIIIIKWN